MHRNVLANDALLQKFFHAHELRCFGLPILVGASRKRFIQAIDERAKDAGRDRLGGSVAAGLIVPVFLFRHYVQDKGVFPPANGIEPAGTTTLRRAGPWAWAALAACVAVVAVAHSLARLPGVAP